MGKLFRIVAFRWGSWPKLRARHLSTACHSCAVTHDRPQNNLDGLRLILAASVIVAHAFALRRLPDPLTRWVSALDLGSVAVDGFFVISGYLIAGSYLRSKSIADYLLKRVLRIYPGFIVAFVASAVLLPWLLNSTHASAFTMVRRVVMLDSPGVAPKVGALNGSMWTILPEFACYLIVPFVARLRPMAVATMTLGAFVAFALTQLVPSLAIRGSERLADAPRFLLFFLLGTLAYASRMKLNHPAVAAVFTLASLFHPIATVIVFPAAFAYLALSVGLASVPVLRDASRFGDFSYGLYLYAFPVQVYLLARGDARSALSDSLVVLCATLPFASASWFVIERPAMKLKRRLATASTHVAVLVAEAKPDDVLAVREAVLSR